MTRRAPTLEGHEVCVRCDAEKPFSAFDTHKNGRSGTDSKCKACKRSYYREQRKDPEYRLKEYRWEVRRRYGLSPEAHRALVEATDNKCQICGVSDEDVEQRLHVDHDHDTGEVRGLLCFKCNTGLGRFNDDPALLTLAALYLTNRTAAKKAV